MKYLFPLVALFAMLFTGCSPEPGPEIPEEYQEMENLEAFPADPEPPGEIALTREAAYGDTGEVILGSIIRGVGVDGKGRVYIGDSRAFTVRVYRPDGSHLRDIGRQGNGPGEFQRLHTFKIADEKLHVLDYNEQRISVFDLSTFEYVRDLNVALREDGESRPSWYQRTRENKLYYRAGDFFVRPDGNYLTLFYDQSVVIEENLYNRTYEVSLYNTTQGRYSRHDLLSFKWTGNRLLFHKTENGIRVMFDVPYKRSSEYDYANGTLVRGVTEEMLFRFHDADAHYRKAWYFPRDKRELSRQEALDLYSSETAKELIREDELPDTWPAFHSLLLDDRNRLWVSFLTENREEHEWWVLGENGELLAEFTWPARESFEVVRDGKLYTLVSDRQTGVQEVIRYNIEW